MKSITIHMPWAELILLREKTIEVRSWKTRHRGALLICAGKNKLHELAGKAICVVNLMGIRKMHESDRNAAQVSRFYDRDYAWILKDVRPIIPFCVRGMPGLFEINDLLIHYERG